MPELPDVEGFKRYFESTSLHKPIEAVHAKPKSIIKKATFSDFKNTVVGRNFVDAQRRGKFLVTFLADSQQKVVFHFGMTGNFSYKKQGSPQKGRDRFTRVWFKFENGYELRWNCMRKLGGVYLVKHIEQIGTIAKMGPEPLDLNQDEFMHLLEAHEKRNIKSFLMDQEIIAGVGNVYADEILFQAAIRPDRKINTLSSRERKTIFKELSWVLKKATKAIDHIKQVSEFLTAHRHEDNLCPNNNDHRLETKNINGRTAFFCPQCQK